MGNVILSTRGTNFLWNGKPETLLTATSFGFMGLPLDDKKRWLDRVQDWGANGIRVFGEYMGFTGKFFWDQLAPLPNNWDWDAVGSKIQILPSHAKLLRQTIRILQQRDMIMEYTITATLKGRANSLRDPSFRSHMCRAIGRWFYEYELEHGATNTLFEIENEFDTVEMKKRLALDSIDKIARRFRVTRPENDPPDHLPDYFGSLIGISEGGQSPNDWKVGYPTRFMSHIPFHSPRNRDWEKVGKDIEKMKAKFELPIYLNENIHVMESEEWDEWIPQIPKWAGLSTKNAKRVLEQALDTIEHKASYCLHYMTGMITNPRRPITRVEKFFKEVFNPGGSPPVLPPPPPPPPVKKSFWEKLFKFLGEFFFYGKVKLSKLSREIDGTWFPSGRF